MRKAYKGKQYIFILVFLIIFSLFALPVTAENIYLEPGVSEFSYTVSFGDIKDAYASAQFDIVIDDAAVLDIRKDENGKTDGIVFSSGLNGVVSDGRMNGNRIIYKVGFVSPTGDNMYKGGMEVCTVHFRYTGVQPRKISICNFEIFRFEGIVDGIPQYSRETVNWDKEITVSLRTQKPGDPGNTGPGTGTPGSDIPAGGQPGGSERNVDGTADGEGNGDGIEKEIGSAETPLSVPSFTDLEGFDWALEAIGSISRKGIIKGDGKGRFMPGQHITRADFVLMLYRMAGFSAENRVTFEDLPESQEYRDAIENAAGCGIVNGIGAGKFDSYGKITRQDAAVIVYRLLKYLDKAGTTPEAPAMIFSDYDQISDYAVEAMNFMINEKILQGSNGYLRPRDPITRAEAAVFLYRVIEKFELI